MICFKFHFINGKQNNNVDIYKSMLRELRPSNKQINHDGSWLKDKTQEIDESKI